MKNRIKSIDPGSVAEELGIEAGDSLVAINGRPVVDIMDFLYFMDDDYMELVIQKPDGQEWDIEIEKSYDEVLGINFDNPILDQAQRCSNQCVFCFIDQLPKGMRNTLYFKDDDSRLSFLMGNFVTLTNMNEATFNRLIEYRISPINVSVHTVDPALRVQMLGNRHAGNILERLQKLKAAGIEMNGQVVLVPGLNDGAYLDETIDALSHLYPYMFSMAVVPIGLTKFREGLFEARPVDKASAQAVLKKIDHWQEQLLERLGTRFVFAADEFFLKAERAIPDADYYEGYVQIENGVGLLRRLDEEFEAALATHAPELGQPEHVLIGTSTAAADLLTLAAQKTMALRPSLKITVLPIENRFFGESITVAGLLTGQDVAEAILTHNAELVQKGEVPIERVLLPQVMLNTDGLFLDDWTPERLGAALGLPFEFVAVTGQALVDALFRR